MRRRDVVSFLAFGAIVVCVLAYIASLGIRVSPPSKRTTLAMDVRDVNGLVVGSNVLLRGVPVGKVTDVTSNANAARIEFYVDGDQRIPVNTEVRLENLSALGESYIGLLPRASGGPMLTSGQRIATEEVVAPASISELANSVVRVLNQLDPHMIKRVVAEGDSALPDPNVFLPNISRASLLLKNAAADMQGRGKLLLSNFQTLLQNAEWMAPALKGLAPSLVETGRSIQDVYRSGVITLHKGGAENMAMLNNLVARIQGLLDDRGADLKVIGEAFEPKLNDIAGALMNFDTGQLLDNVLAMVPPDGTITLRVVP
ncbi:MlaD family protein [Mycobacterium sp. NPDC003449]